MSYNLIICPFFRKSAIELFTFTDKCCFIKDVCCVAEFAGDLKLAGLAFGFLLVKEFLDVLFTERCYRAEHSLFRAGATVFDLVFVEDVVFNAVKSNVCDLLK